MSCVEEIEFLCANSEYSDYSKLLQSHKKLHKIFSKKKGLVSYRQNNSSNGEKQFAFAVLILDKKLKPFVIKQAKRANLPVDLASCRKESFLGKVMNKELENQI